MPLSTIKPGRGRRLALALITACAMAGAGAAQAATVTKLAGNVYQNLYGVAADQFGVYVTGATGLLRDFNGQFDDGVVGSIPLAGGPVATLYSKANYTTQSGHVTPLQIASDGAGHLVWSDPEAGASTGSAVLSGDRLGTTPTFIVNTCCGPGAFPGDAVGAATLGGLVYFTDSAGGGVGSVSGSAITQIGDTRFGPDFNLEMWSQMAVTAKQVFVADSGQQPTVDNGVQALIDRSTSAGTGVRYLTPGAGTAFTTLTAVIRNPHGIVAVGKYLFVTTAGKIWRVNIKTGKAKVYSASPRFVDLQGIAYYNGVLYVADDQNTYGPYSAGGVADAKSDKPGVVWKVEDK